MEIVVKTLMGLEGVLAEEIEALGLQDVQKMRRAVSFEGGLEDIYRANYLLRCGLNVLVPIIEFTAHNYTDIYQGGLGVNWEDIFDLNQTFVIRCNIHSPYFKNSQYATQRLKDAITDRFVQNHGKRPSVDKDNPDIVINMRIFEREIYLHLDSSGVGLYKRGYYKDRGIAPMNEVLAAGLIKMSGWKTTDNFFDPMCGSGTFLLEAASMAHEVPSQFHRNHFGFMNWQNFDEEIWEKVKEEHKPIPKNLTNRFYSSDIDQNSLDNIERNASALKFKFLRQIWRADFFKLYLGVKPGYMFINPPYNQRISIDDATGWYMRLGKVFKSRYKGWKICIISADIDSLKHVGLKPDKKIELRAGGLEAMCYVLNIFDR